MKRTRLKSMSGARRSLDSGYRAIVEILKTRVWSRCARCQLSFDHLDAHHPYKRGKSKKFSWKIFVVVPVCRTCHDEIHADEKQAREDGWLIEPKYKDPYQI